MLAEKPSVEEGGCGLGKHKTFARNRIPVVLSLQKNLVVKANHCKLFVTSVTCGVVCVV